MNYEEDSTNNEHSAEDERKEQERLHAEFGDDKSDDDEADADKRKKRSVLVRILRFFWRRRVFWPIKNGKQIIEIILAAGIFLATATQAYIYLKQTKIMERALGQNRDSNILGQGQLAVAARNAKTAEETLVELQKGGTDTHALATAAKTTATATQSAATTAKDTLHISERAYVIQISPQLDSAKSMINLPIFNSGHIPSGKVDVVVYEVTFNPDKITMESTSFQYIVERNKGISHFASIPPGYPPTMNIGVPVTNMSTDRLDNGTQMILIVGTVDYNDGFPGSPAQRSIFCTNTVYHTVAKSSFMSACDAATELPKIEALDWTGLTHEN
jgi:hypothetical protein